MYVLCPIKGQSPGVEYKADQAEFTDWMSFPPSELIGENQP